MISTKPRLSFSERAKLSSNPTSKKLFQLMDSKGTNLAFNPDVTEAKELIRLADLAGPYICVLKTHIDIVKDFDKSLPKILRDLSQKHNFLIFEDRKFSDIGSVVKMQYEAGLYQISSWADITNAHPVPGPGVIEGLKEVGMPLGRGLLLVAEMSSSGSLAHGSYTESAIEMAENHPEFVIGFICQRRLTDNPRYIHMTPGVKMETGKDPLGQQYNTPEKAIKERGSDVIIVGRGIKAAKDPAKTAALYRDAAIQALTQDK